MIQKEPLLLQDSQLASVAPDAVAYERSCSSLLSRIIFASIEGL
jgi:hypothetical protein